MKEQNFMNHIIAWFYPINAHLHTLYIVTNMFHFYVHSYPYTHTPIHSYTHTPIRPYAHTPIRPYTMLAVVPDIIGSTLQTPTGDLQVTFNCSCAYDNQCSCGGVKFACLLLNSAHPVYVQCKQLHTSVPCSHPHHIIIF